MKSILTFSRPLVVHRSTCRSRPARRSRSSTGPTTIRPARNFFRPKGSVTLGWRPAKGWDVSLKLRRRVGQISFYDFLAQPKLSSDRENAGNPNLVPPQSWEVETEFSRDLGAWGKTRLNLHYYRVSDIVDVIPIGDNQEGIGNLPRADRIGAESVSTINFDPIGWTGAKLDLTLGGEWTSVKDPLTGKKRPITSIQDRWGTAEVRHDIPERRWRGAPTSSYRHYTKNYFLTEVFRELDIPWMVGFYVEDKNVFGMTVRASVDNIFNGRHTLDRVVYTGLSRPHARSPSSTSATSWSGRSSACRSRAPSSLLASALLGLHSARRSAMPKVDLGRHRANQPHRLSAAVRQGRCRVAGIARLAAGGRAYRFRSRAMSCSNPAPGRRSAIGTTARTNCW